MPMRVPEYDDMPWWAQLGLFLLASLGTASMFYLQFEGEKQRALSEETDDEADEYYEQAYQRRRQRRSA